MKTTVRLTAAAILVLLLMGQTGFAQKTANLSRTVLHTLAENEEVYASEYYAAMTLSGNKYAVITYNKQTEKYSFIFNGEYIVKDAGWVDLVYLKPEVNNSYSVSYWLEKDWSGDFYVIYRGVKDGPFENGQLLDGGYAYQLAGRWYVNIQGKITGPYTGGFPDHRTNSGKYAFSYEKDGAWYANINGQSYGPYDNYYSVYSPQITESGKYAFGYKKDGAWYVNINGQSYGPYSGYYYIYPDRPDLQITESGKYAFSYENDGAIYTNTNGTVAFKSVYFPGARAYGRGSLEMVSPDQQHSFFSDYSYEYVVIDGKKIGNAPAIYAEYDEKKKSFVWNAIEDKELVVYAYKVE